MNKEIEQLKTELAELKRQFELLKSTTTIPYDIDRAFYERYKMIEFARLSPSSKSATSESQSVNEGGVASYSVLKNPDGFEQREVGGVVRYYAYWL